MSFLAFPSSAVPSNDIDLELANHVTSLRSTEDDCFAVLTLFLYNTY